MNKDILKVLKLKYENKNKAALSLALNLVKIEDKCKDELYYQIGVLYAIKRNFSKALRYLNKSISLNPDKFKSYIELAYIYYYQQIYDKAIEVLQKAQDLNANYKVFSLKGMVELDRGNLDIANILIKKALAKLPYDSETLYYYGNLLIEKQEYEKAVIEYEKALKYNNLFDEEKLQGLNNNLGYCYYYLKEYDKSLDIFSKLVKSYPDKALYWNNLARLYIEKGDFKKAINYLKKAKKLDENLDLIYLNFALIYKKEGNIAKAKQFLKKALFLNPYNEEALEILNSIELNTKENN